MNICKERFFELTQDQYLKIKKFIDNNIDVIDYALAPMNNYFDLYKNVIIIIIVHVIIMLLNI